MPQLVIETWLTFYGDEKISPDQVNVELENNSAGNLRNKGKLHTIRAPGMNHFKLSETQCVAKGLS